MRVVIFNGSVVNPGDLSWDCFSELGDVVYCNMDSEGVLDTISDVDAIIGIFGQSATATREFLEHAKRLKYIGLLSTGFNTVDIEYCKKEGITVTNVPSYGTAMVAQYAVSLLLEICGKMQGLGNRVKRGEWSKRQDVIFAEPIIELDGKTAGIIGFGRIGKRTAKIVQALGMNVLYSDSFRSREEESESCSYASLEDVLSKSDVIFLHCPLTEENRHLIDEKAISKMKDGVIIINNARGPLIDEEALARALHSGKVYAAGLDVAETEPISDESPLLSEPHALITPHISWVSKESRGRMINIAFDNLKEYLEGHPVNVVS